MKKVFWFSVIPVLLIACYIGFGIRVHNLPRVDGYVFVVEDTQATVAYTYMYSDWVFDGEITTVGSDNYKAVVQTPEEHYTVTLTEGQYNTLKAGDLVDIMITETQDEKPKVVLK